MPDIVPVFAWPGVCGSSQINPRQDKPRICHNEGPACPGKYVGATEKHIDALFDAAEAGGNALFLDEADAVFGKRSEVKDSHDRYANIAAAAILRRLRSFDGIAILASKTKEVGSSLLRQADFVVDLPKASNARSGSGR